MMPTCVGGVGSGSDRAVRIVLNVVVVAGSGLAVLAAAGSRAPAQCQPRLVEQARALVAVAPQTLAVDGRVVAVVPQVVVVADGVLVLVAGRAVSEHSLAVVRQTLALLAVLPVRLLDGGLVRPLSVRRVAQEVPEAAGLGVVAPVGSLVRALAHRLGITPRQTLAVLAVAPRTLDRDGLDSHPRRGRTGLCRHTQRGDADSAGDSRPQQRPPVHRVAHEPPLEVTDIDHWRLA